MKEQIRYSIFTLVLLATMVLPGCIKVEDVNLNTPTAEGIPKDPTVAELNNLVTGAESGLRVGLAYYLDDVGVLGREMYRFSGSEPRYTTELLGASNAQLDSNAFYIANAWGASYAVIKNANILLEAAKNCRFITDAQRKGYTGLAKTLIAYNLLMALNLTYDNGVRIDVSDINHLGPIVDKDQGLTAIAQLLNDGETDLSGAEKLYNLSSGFEGFDDPAGLVKVNRAIAARVDVYQKRWTDALTDLGTSFYDLNGALTTGVYDIFSTNPGDQLNPFYLAQNSTGEVRAAHPSYAADIENGDDRIGKATLRDNAVSQSGLTSDRDVWVYTSNLAPVPIVRNEELVLIFAEASIQSDDLVNGTGALNVVRHAHGLGNYSGAATKDALIDEMLNQRRYSLFCEGHRWIDMRRYDRLSDLPIDRPGDDVFSSFPLPILEKGAQ